MKLLKAYNLGSLGIDIVNSPVHVADTSLLNCQNAQISPDDRELGITKRNGMSKVNSLGAGGSILAIINIPISS